MGIASNRGMSNTATVSVPAPLTTVEGAKCALVAELDLLPREVVGGTHAVDSFGPRWSFLVTPCDGRPQYSARIWADGATDTRLHGDSWNTEG